MSLELPKNPAELGGELVLWRSNDSGYLRSFNPTREEELDLIWLEQAADQANLGGDWVVEARRGFVIPKSFDTTGEVTMAVLDKVLVDGNFACYSRIAIAEIVGLGAIRAICMTFDSGLLIKPRIAELDETDLLHIPVMSVEDISRPVQ